MIKKSIAGFLSCMFCLCFLDSVKVESAVIEPEIVKTETWTTSYFIDNNIDTLYPYIQCEADIYNDGTIKLYMWNTHEWTGFNTYKHDITILGTEIYKPDSIPYAYYYENTDKYISFRLGNSILDNTIGDDGIVPNENNNEKVKKLFISSFNCIPNNYSCRQLLLSGYRKGYGILQAQTSKSKYEYVINATIGMYNVALPEIGWLEKQCVYEFIPNSEPIEDYQFRLFGHDITITPELLSGNIVAQPELTEQEKYIKQLEEENEKLKTENEHYKETLNTDKDLIIKNLESEKEMLEDTLYQYKLIDYNGNGKLDVDDSQMILMYYVNTLAGKYTGTIEDYAVYRNDKAYESMYNSGGN